MPKSKEERFAHFVSQSRELYGDKYQYHIETYTRTDKDTVITCPIHGDFKLKPYLHLRGYECPECSGRREGLTRKLTQEEFIARCTEIHHGKYDYSKVEYKNCETDVTIICPKHGEFQLSPQEHLYQEEGCPKCAGKYRTTEELVGMFREKWGDTYDYSKVVFDKMGNPVTIICPIHGEFTKTPNKHLAGQGCQKCGYKVRNDKHRLPLAEFIRRANEIHDGKYDYSQVSYNKTTDKVTIICPIHGPFTQRGSDHLNGHGCQECGTSSLEKEVEKILKRHDVSFIKECDASTFGWLGRLRLDFYIPDKKAAIECQGEQHFTPIEHFGGEDEFQKIADRDKRKLELCKEHGIRIIYYTNVSRYKEFLGEQVIHDEFSLIGKLI